MAYFEDFSELIAPDRLSAARSLYDVLATVEGMVDPDLFLARLRAQGLLDDAAARRYRSDETIELTVVRPNKKSSSDTTVVLQQSAGSTVQVATPPSSSDSRQQVQGIGLATVTLDRAASQYSLLGRLNAGAMGQIHLAKDRDLRRKVAYKQLLTGLETRPGLVQRFLLEAQVMAQLDHPNVVPVYALEQIAEGRFAYAMKLVRGQTLASLLREAHRCIQERRILPMDLSRVTLLDHFLKVCDAMSYAHARGVLHRDLKPSNIMIGQFREVYVMDWGLARVIHAPDLMLEPDSRESISLRSNDPTATQTRLGDIMGTPSYMSPEQASGDHANLDARSDLYALGLILFELISLQRALHAPSLETALKMAQRGDKQPLKDPSAALKIPRELRAIIAKATATRRQARYQTVTELADDLRRFLRDEPVTALPDTWSQRILRWIGRHRQTTLQLLMAVFLVALSAIGWDFYQRFRSLAEIQAHKERLSVYLTSVAKSSHTIDRHFMFFEELLEGLSSAVMQARLNGAASKESVYLLKEYRARGLPPSDLAAASRYGGRPISTEYPVFIMAPGVSAASPGLRDTMQRLAPVRRNFQRMFLLSRRFHNPLLTTQSPTTDLHQITGEQRGPLVWAYFALREGLLVMYPGQGSPDLPADYDPRQHPWYQDVAGKSGKFWGRPYRDRLGQGVLLSCSMPLLDGAGQLLGVAGIDVSLDYVIEQFMSIPGQRVRESFLLDREGRIVVRSSDRHDDPNLIEARSIEKPVLYPYSDIVADLQAGKSSYREIDQNGQKVWIVYNDIKALEWTYVVEFVQEK